MSDFGLYAKGSAENLIIGPDDPVMAVLYSAPLLMTGAAPQVVSAYGVRRGKQFTFYDVAKYRQCSVTYPRPITTAAPPLVFAVPNASAIGLGLAFFTHTGSAGAWTGFKVYAATMDVGNWSATISSAANAPCGWDYKVCSFSAPASTDAYGLRVWDGDARLVFDSGWKIAPFRQLLTGWVGAGQYIAGDLLKFANGEYSVYLGVTGTHWGNGSANANKQIDSYWHRFSHPWGATDGDLGILISSMCQLPMMVDNGFNDYHAFYSAGVIGFPDYSRGSIYLSLPVGWAQHVGINPQTINNFSMLTADFSKA